MLDEIDAHTAIRPLVVEVDIVGREAVRITLAREVRIRKTGEGRAYYNNSTRRKNNQFRPMSQHRYSISRHLPVGLQMAMLHNDRKGAQETKSNAIIRI
jgi:hypothetical protein